MKIFFFIHVKAWNIIQPIFQGIWQSKRLYALKYDEHRWEVNEFYKVILGILMHHQIGFTQFLCYHCLWDSKGIAALCITRGHWLQRKEFCMGRTNVNWEPLIKMKSSAVIAPLHTKLGLIEDFLKTLDKESAAFKYLQGLFPTISEAKVKWSIFIRPHIY